MVLMLKVYNDNIDIDIGVTVDGEVVVGRRCSHRGSSPADVLSLRPRP